MIKYIIYPGYVESNDGDTHYISYNTLIRLYDVNPEECIQYDRLTARECLEFRDCKRLYPSRNGNYNLKDI